MIEPADLRGRLGRIPGFIRDHSWMRIALLFVAARLGLSLWVWLAVELIPMPLWPDERLRPYYGVTPEVDPLLSPWQRWDTLHYQAIAERGYRAFDTALFVPPLLPALMRVGASWLGGNTLLAGLTVSGTAALLLMYAFHRLAEAELGDRDAAWRSVLYLLTFPTAFFLFAAYTESLFLLGAVTMISFVRQRQWLRAGFGAALAALARLPGALVLLPLGWATVREAWKCRQAYPLLGFLVGVAGALVFPAYTWIFLGLSPWTPLIVQTQRFGGAFTLPGLNVLEAMAVITRGSFFVTDALDLLFLAGGLAMALPVWRRLPRVYGVYYFAQLALFLTRTGGSEPLVGMVRYVLALFPAFLVLGQWGVSRWVHRAILYTGTAGMLFMSAGFALWLWMG